MLFIAAVDSDFTHLRVRQEELNGGSHAQSAEYHESLPVDIFECWRNEEAKSEVEHPVFD